MPAEFLELLSDALVVSMVIALGVIVTIATNRAMDAFAAIFKGSDEAPRDSLPAGAADAEPTGGGTQPAELPPRP